MRSGKFLVLIGMFGMACRARSSREPSAAEIEAVCRERACRDDTTQVFAVGPTAEYRGVYPRSPYIAGPGVVVVLPGEAIRLAASVSPSGELADLKVVPQGGVLEVAVSRERGATMLTIKSNLDRPLFYCAYINIPGTGRVKTSIVGIEAKLRSVEIWEDTIIEIVLTNFRLTDTLTGCR
jgi:hypothetical protein